MGNVRLDLLIAFACFAFAPAALAAQQVEAMPGVPGEELTVYLMTMGPGPNVWERFGHNAIWIHDASAGTDIAYNYGMFSFEQENFILRFIRGQMDYWMEGFDARLMANAYIAQGRSVWADELNLTPAQRAELRDFLEWNALPENRFYRYDYYVDNCSTRVRDVIDGVLGGRIRSLTESVPTGQTYRDHTQRLTFPDAFLYTGLMLGLGQPVDREISAWEEMFLPLQLRDRFGDLTVLDESGAAVPLIRAEEVIFLSPIERAAPAAPNRLAGYLFVGSFLALAIFAAGRYAPHRQDAALVLRILVVGWGALAGILGLVLLGLWLFTDHEAAYRNENLFFYNPVLLAVAVLIPLALSRPAVYSRAAMLVAGSVAVLSLLGWIADLLPAFYQDNVEMIAVALPVNLALFVAAWTLHQEAGVGPRMPRPRTTLRGEPIQAGT